MISRACVILRDELALRVLGFRPGFCRLLDSLRSVRGLAAIALAAPARLGERIEAEGLPDGVEVLPLPKPSAPATRLQTWFREQEQGQEAPRILIPAVLPFLEAGRIEECLAYVRTSPSPCRAVVVPDTLPDACLHELDPFNARMCLCTVETGSPTGHNCVVRAMLPEMLDVARCGDFLLAEAYATAMTYA